MATLGSLWLSESAFAKCPYLRREMFWQPAHQTIFDVLRDISVQGRGLDLVTIKAELIARGQLAQVGGVEYIKQLYDAVANSDNAAFYADIVRTKWVRRELMARARRVLSLAAGGPESDYRDAVEAASVMVQGLLPSTSYEFSIADLLDGLSDSLPAGQPSGLSCIDEHSKCGGFYPSEPNYIVSKRGVGKSVFLLQMIRKACDEGKHVLFVSLEMDGKQVTQRLLQQLTGCWSKDHAAGLELGAEWKAANEDMRLWDLLVYDTSTVEVGASCVENVRDWVLAKHEARSVDLLVVDYVQLLRTSERTHGKTEVMETVEAKLRALSRRCGFVPLYAAQLQENKDGAAYIRNSLEFENGASLVLHLLEQEDGYKLLCTKNRHGKGRWDKTLVLDRTHLTFSEELPPDAPPAGDRYDD